MLATDAVGTREIVFEIMTPFVRNHVIVELLDIVAVHTQQEQRVDVAAVK